MSSNSNTNLNENSKIQGTLYTYLQDQPIIKFLVPSISDHKALRDNDYPPPTPPVRDSSSLKSIKYGPGHEKFPSWPVPAAAETSQIIRNHKNGGFHRSKSWADHTNYPKEKIISYTRPYINRQYVTCTQEKLKTVMEKHEKIPPETFELCCDKLSDRIFLPNHKNNRKLGDINCTMPALPERDLSSKTQLPQSVLKEFARTYQEPKFIDDTMNSNHKLTESGLEEFMEYTRNHEDSLFNSMNSKHDGSVLTHIHQKQISYAHSEGYHSYVSSTDSTSTPFLDRLRRDSEAAVGSSISSNTWDELNPEDPNSRSEGRDSVVTTSSGSVSSSETLKWHGSMSDVSVTSHSSSRHNSNSSTRQLIAHSARVQTPKRHHSESVLYMVEEKESSLKTKAGRNCNVNKLKFFPLNTYNTYIVQENENQSANISKTSNHRLSLSPQSELSVAARISELEKQQKYSYYDPEKKHKFPDPTLKAIQKKALLSFYERHNNPNKSYWISEPQLPHTNHIYTQPLLKLKTQMASRRASSASDYAGNNSKRSSLASNKEKIDLISQTVPRHQHNNSCGSLSTDILGPIIVGSAISVDDYVPDQPPERPPKHPNLRTAFPDLFLDQRVPSPDLPPPSPPTVLENEVFNNDEPFPPPPPECKSDLQEAFSDTAEICTGYQIPAPQMPSELEIKVIEQTVGLPERYLKISSTRSSIKMKSSDQIFKQVNTKPYISTTHSEPNTKADEKLGFPHQRGYQERASTRYPSTQKLKLHGAVSVSQKVTGLSEQYRPKPLSPHKKIDSNLLPVYTDAHLIPRALITESSSKEVAPLLHPRQMRIIQSMKAQISNDHKNCSSKKEVREERSSSVNQSKVSYLSARHEKEQILPESDAGSNKRTTSPSGHELRSEPISEAPKIKEIFCLSHTPLKNSNISRISSMNETNIDKCDLKNNLVLPDVLPVNAKLRSLYHATSELCDTDSQIILPKPLSKSPPSSSPKGLSRNCSFTKTFSTITPSTAIITSSRTFSQSPTAISSSLSAFSTPFPTDVSSYSEATVPISRLSISSVNLGTSIRSTAATLPRMNISGSKKLKTITITPPSYPDRTSPSITKLVSGSSHLVKCSPSPTSTLKWPPVKISMTSTSSTPVISSSPITLQSPEYSPLISSTLKENYPQGLQLIQRTEVVVRVNATIDAASQTEKEVWSSTPLSVRKKLKEEIEYEKLAEDLVDHLSSSDRLKGLLVTLPEHKKSTDYIQGLFREEISSRPRPMGLPFSSKNNASSTTSPPVFTLSVTTSTTSTVSSATSKLSISPSPPITSVTSSFESSLLSGSSTCFVNLKHNSTYSIGYNQERKNCLTVKNITYLNQKKEELINRVEKKLKVLRTEQLIIKDDCKINDDLGEDVKNYMNMVARPHEAAKFRLHVEEIEKITNLLLSLSSRLAKTENMLMDMSKNDLEKEGRAFFLHPAGGSLEAASHLK
ncbi:uncharacterized protein Shrm isoform X2 [Diabrotica undecimpunctata]|uniref:uncharacterized protein Shrm isoform X2 n=1 Tax=Diabrotica undecimpunctata TaxID=50387 RepID=UPI003B63D42C